MHKHLSAISDDESRGYWDALAPEYRRITRISCADFHYGPQIPGEKTLKILPPLNTGARALELGCGGGENSVWLSCQGLHCDAFDISEAQLAYARKIAKRKKAEINFFQASLSDFSANENLRAPYDFLHSSHAMEFAADPAAVVRDMSAAMKRGAWLMISTVHPLYNGEWIEAAAEDDGDDFSAGLFLANYFTPPDDIRDEFGEHIISRAHPISAWFKWFKDADLSVEEIGRAHV